MLLDEDVCTEHQRPTVACACCTLFYCDEFYEEGICPGCRQHRALRPEMACGGREYRAYAESDPQAIRIRKAMQDLKRLTP